GSPLLAPPPAGGRSVPRHAPPPAGDPRGSAGDPPLGRASRRPAARSRGHGGGARRSRSPGSPDPRPFSPLAGGDGRGARRRAGARPRLPGGAPDGGAPAAAGRAAAAAALGPLLPAAARGLS